MTTTLDMPRTAAPELSLARLHATRGRYLLMGLAHPGQWPELPDVQTMPL